LDLSLEFIDVSYCQIEAKEFDMATHSPPQDVAMTDGQTPPFPAEEPKYAGFSRFEIELEVRLALLLAPSHAQPQIPCYSQASKRAESTDCSSSTAKAFTALPIAISIVCHISPS
jgi:hypothetical protein